MNERQAEAMSMDTIRTLAEMLAQATEALRARIGGVEQTGAAEYDSWAAGLEYDSWSDAFASSSQGRSRHA